MLCWCCDRADSAMPPSCFPKAAQHWLQLRSSMHAAHRWQPGSDIERRHRLALGLVICVAWAAADTSGACPAEAAANKYIQERFVPKLVAAGIVVCVDIVRRPDDESPQGAAIVKKADEIDAATIVLCPHQQDFTEVCKPDASLLADGGYALLGSPLDRLSCF